MERTYEEIISIANKLSEAESNKQSSHKKLATKKQDVEKLKAELQRLQELDQYDDLIRQCLIKLVWVDIFAKQRILENKKTELETKRVELRRATDRLEKCLRHQADSGDLSKLQEDVETVEQESAQVQLELHNIQQELMQAQKNLNAAINDCNSIAQYRARAQSRLDAVRKEVQYA